MLSRSILSIHDVRDASSVVQPVAFLRQTRGLVGISCIPERTSHR